MGRLSTLGVVGVVVLQACRERAQAVQSQAELRQRVAALVPAVERAAGLKFRRPPVVEVRSRDKIRSYVVAKLDAELPPAELAGYEAGLKLFGLIPDTLDLKRTIANVLYEQIAGYYDPDSNAFYIAADLDPYLARVTASHELVHALQDQHLNLDSIMQQRRQNDRRVAAQAVLEGQATLTQIPVLMPEQRPDTLPPDWFWRQREVMAAQHAQMKEFASAPLWLREGLVFPYLAGADFVNWYSRNHRGRHPFGAAMPTSTEQIMHPERYAQKDEPTTLRFTTGGPELRYEDELGEFEIRLLFTVLTGVEGRATVLAAGWDGDRYAVIGERRDVLVWYSVWDGAAEARRFAEGLERAWRSRRSPGSASRRSDIEQLDVDGLPGVRLVDAPVAWAGWGAIPTVHVRQEW
ncbi:MAG TPA: hypothetical protein VGA20_00390 [Gemmatimonadales bacterium]